MALNLVGFDSAWSDNPRAPGAICAIRLDADAPPIFDPPRQAGFEAARAFVLARHRAGDLTLLAIDQPTIVPNAGGARPVERAVASLMSYSGGGIQPAFRGKAPMFGDGAPIWRFLAEMRFVDDPQAACEADEGGFVMEVFPALAMLGLDPTFMVGRGCGPRYNPSRATFKLTAWQAVCRATAREARRLGLGSVAEWCDSLDAESKPRKRTQDELDAVICLVVAARWRWARASCLMIGDGAHGYIVAPVSPETRAYLTRAAKRCDVAVA